MKKTTLYLATLVVLVVALGVSLMFFGGPRTPVHATTTCPVSADTTCLAGWAWSSNIGWVSFNSSDDSGTTAQYDVAMDTSGNLTGYAWSSNVGWISFNSADLSASPACSGTVAPTVNTGTGAVTGWARVISEKGRSDGWDGCIELSGANHASPDTSGNSGVTYVSSTGFNGFAWGGNVVGWLHLNVTCPNCSSVLTVNDLSFTATSSSGIATQNVAYTLPSVGGSITVPLQWIVNSATSIKIASTSGSTGVATDWGVNSGSTVTLSGKSVTSNGTDSITFSTAGTKILKLSYKLNGSPTSQQVTVTIAPYQAPVVNTCIQPANIAAACGLTNSGYASTVTQCTASVACQFSCASGYHPNPQGNACVKSSIQEI